MENIRLQLYFHAYMMHMGGKPHVLDIFLCAFHACISSF